ncbi:uncharacterized protein A4U43_C05F220 [Asparagus officinalis]|uniref:Uncharacterized protein n=1 Tax=Asparagus officinalis TaxID=4686 RepID=A0A5P1EP63_ASPOF|nr:uncharacterized protein A4U43_C05F220 [Asparagus officinalis]
MATGADTIRQKSTDSRKEACATGEMAKDLVRKSGKFGNIVGRCRLNVSFLLPQLSQVLLFKCIRNIFYAVLSEGEHCNLCILMELNCLHQNPLLTVLNSCDPIQISVQFTVLQDVSISLRTLSELDIFPLLPLMLDQLPELLWSIF